MITYFIFNKFIQARDTLIKKLYFLIVSIILFIFFRVSRYSFFLIDTSRIGHMVQQFFEIFYEIKSKKFKNNLIIFPTLRIANKNLFQAFQKFYKLNNISNIRLKNQKLLNFLNFYNKNFNFLKDVSVGQKCNWKLYEKNNNFFFNFLNNLFGPNLDLIKKKLNLKNKYVVIFTRDVAYFKNNIISYKHSLFRNSNIKNLFKAAETFKKKNYDVIRVGSFVNEKIFNKNVLDYSNSKFQCEINDLLLLSNCDIFLGDTSGISTIPGLAGKIHIPINIAPLESGNFIRYKSHLIYKKYFCIKKKKYLTLREILDKNLYNCHYSHIFNENNIIVVENTKDEINSLCKNFLKGKLDLKYQSKEYKEKFSEYKKILNFYYNRKKINFDYINMIDKSFFINRF